MARFKGLFQFIGTLGGVTAVNSKEGLYIKTTNSISKSRYRQGEEYADFRMNGRYMSMGSKLSMAFRKVLGIYSHGVCNSRMYSRMNAMMRSIIMCDGVSGKGEFTAVNGIATEEGKNLLRQFVFNNNCDFSNVFHGFYDLDSVTGVVTLPGFNPELHLSALVGSTHVGIQSGVMRFDFEDLSGVFYGSEKVVLPLVSVATDVILTADFPSGGDGTLVYFLKFYFMQDVNGVLYPLKGAYGGVMRVIGVY